MDVWGPARIQGQGREQYILLLPERFDTDLPVLCLHSDRGGEFSSDLLQDFYRGEGITETFTLPASPQQNRVAERRIGLVMEVARTSMIHAAAPHFLWSFAVRYTAHQLNLWPRVSLPETSSTLRWMGEVGDVLVFRVDPLLLVEPVEVTGDSGATEGAEPAGAEPECAEPGGAELVREEPGGAEPAVAEPEREEPRGAEPANAEPRGAAFECAELGGA
ncbi:unnamed protein product [Closterium sp. NIES-65]|nr:unnamed protein product [Closterium sp. NIES-65]